MDTFNRSVLDKRPVEFWVCKDFKYLVLDRTSEKIPEFTEKTLRMEIQGNDEEVVEFIGQENIFSVEEAVGMIWKYINCQQNGEWGPFFATWANKTPHATGNYIQVNNFICKMPKKSFLGFQKKDELILVSVFWNSELIRGSMNVIKGVEPIDREYWNIDARPIKNWQLSGHRQVIIRANHIPKYEEPFLVIDPSDENFIRVENGRLFKIKNNQPDDTTEISYKEFLSQIP